MLSQYFPLMKMARRRRTRLCWPTSSLSSGDVERSESRVLIGNKVSCLPSSMFHFKFSLKLRHVILTTLFLLTLCHHIPCANSQPLLNQLAILLRSRPAWPTSFPSTAPQQQQNNLQQQQSPSAIQQQISIQSSHVYPTSSEQLQNFIASNNLAQGPLSQGIPVVAMDPSQNSITIMTPTGPEQIMAPSPSGMGGGGVFVAQPIHQNDNPVIHNNSTVTNNGNNGQSTNINGNNNNNTPPGTIVQVMPNPVTFDGQSLMDGSVFAAAAAGIPPLPQSGSSNIAFPGFPGNFPNEQHHIQASFPAGFIVHGSHTGQGHNNINNQPILNSQPQVAANGLPLPPPIPKNLKGPAIIAVPKTGPPSSTYMGGPVETNLQHLSSNPSASSSGHGAQPIIIHSFHQLPNLTPAFPQLFPPVQSYPHESMISLPENAMVPNLHLELNKTSAIRQLPLQPIQLQHETHTQQLLPSHFQPSQHDRNQQPFQQQQQQEQSQSHQQTQVQPEKIQPPQPEKESFAERPLHTELSSEMVGNPRNQRKRHQKQRQFHEQLQQTTRRGIFRRKPTSRPTQIPQPAESESNQNEIDNNKTPSMLDYSLSTIVSLPSTTITGSFEYPDPPTPPNFESMNALKYPSPFEDSAEVAVKSKSLSSSSKSSRERKRLRDELQEQLKSTLHLHNSPFSSNGVTSKRVSPAYSSTSTTTGTHALQASSIYRSLTTASALPESSVFEPSKPEIRETTTFPVSSTTIKKRHHRRKGKSSKSRKDFRPSPQIHSFEEPVTGIKSYITILPPVTTISGLDESDEKRGKQRGKKSLFAKFEANESKHPPHYEVGFKPVSHYTTYSVGNTNTFPDATTTSESMYFDLIREVVSKAPSRAWSKPDLTSENQRQHRLLVTTADGLTITNPFSSSTSNNANYGFTTLSSTSSTDPFVEAGWKVKDHVTNSDDSRRQLTTSASSEVEHWRFPDTTHGSKDSSSVVYFGNGKFGPPNCDKFHRFGFCPMNSGYPTDQVEKIASRCSALLSHLIAPLPKADVRYDVIVAKNGSMLKGKSAAPSGWSWKSFSGKPVCDTKEIKVVPGWAKNERGEWLVILQTKAWKQEAQITLCTPQGTHYNCKGNKSSGNKNNKDCTPIKIKCVQRFTAQRLAVLDPENTDRCPVLRSVFLPSACVCLHDGSPTKPSSSSSLGSSEEISTGSSNTNIVKISSKGSKGSSSNRKGSKGKRSSKKSSSSKRSKKPSSGRSARKSEANKLQALSSEEQENKSDILDTAADSSTSGVKVSNSRTTTENLQEREEKHQEENSGASSEDEDDNEVPDRGPHAEQLISSPAPTGTEEDESTDGRNNQNEVEDDDDENNVVDNAHHSTPSVVDKDEDNGRITSTVTSNSHGGSGTATDETSVSEEGENFEENKVKGDG